MKTCNLRVKNGFALMRLGPLGGANTLCILSIEWGFSQEITNTGLALNRNAIPTSPPIVMNNLLKSCIAFL